MKSRVLIVAVTVASLAGLTWLVRFVARRRGAAPTEWQEVEPLEQSEGPSGSDQKPDPVDQAIAESFPASDPPSWTTGH